MLPDEFPATTEIYGWPVLGLATSRLTSGVKVSNLGHWWTMGVWVDLVRSGGV